MIFAAPPGRARRRTRQALAGLQFQSQRRSDAAETFQEAARSFSALPGPKALRTITARMNAGIATQYAGEAASADPLLAATLSLSQSALGPSHPMTEDVRYHLADCRLDEGKTAGVAQLLKGLSAVGR